MGNKLMSSPALHFTVHHADTSERATRQEVGKSYVPQWYSRENQLHSHGYHKSTLLDKIYVRPQKRSGNTHTNTHTPRRTRFRRAQTFHC